MQSLTTRVTLYIICHLWIAGPPTKRVTEHYEGHEGVAGNGDEGGEREGRHGAAEEEEEQDQKGHERPLIAFRWDDMRILV